MTKFELYKKQALSYVQRVLNGDRVAGELEILAVKRYLSDVENATEKGFYFDEKALRPVFAFFSMLRHFEGEWAGKEFVLSDWQCFILWNVFGWKTADDRRRFFEVGIEVAKKNGKTLFAAAIALIMLLLDNEPGAQVYSAAVDKDQASICWRAAAQMVANSPELQKYLRVFRSSIVYDQAASFFKPLSKGFQNKDGFNPHCGICDELHTWTSDEIFGLISSGMSARRNPLIFCITTAGKNMTLPYYERRTHYVNILRGIKQEETTFCIIYSPDKDDYWGDPVTWQKASPNYGISVYPFYYEKAFITAKNKGGSTEVEFKTKNLNMWVDAPDVWIPDEIVLGCSHGVKDDDLLGQECYGGLDLAAVRDTTALALYFPKQQAVKYFFWIPERKVTETEDRVNYRLWKEQGYINITPGNAIDVDWLTSDITGITTRYDVKNLAYDPAMGLSGVVQNLQKNGLDRILDPYAQNIMNMSVPAKKLESMLLEKELDLLGNPVIRWMLRNVVIYRDPNDNIKLDKKRSQNRIDGAVATVNAIGGYLSNPAPEPFTEIKTLPSPFRW